MCGIISYWGHVLVLIAFRKTEVDIKQKRFEIHCDLIEPWRRENFKFGFVFSVVGRLSSGNVSKCVESYLVGVMCLF